MIVRGAIYTIRALPTARGHEQGGVRLAVVIQSDRFATSTVAVAMTSTSAGPGIYRPKIEVGAVTTRVLTDQVFSVDPSRLGDFRGLLNADELRELDRALLLRFGLL